MLADLKTLPEFKNEPVLDFSQPENRDKMKAALERVAASFNREYPLVIGGEQLYTERKIETYNPSDKDQTVGVFQKATRQQAVQAVEAAYQKFQEWSRVTPQERAAYLLKAAALVRDRRCEIGATMVYEVGKNWTEADADVAEAIDFLEFYAREMLRYAGQQPLVRLPGEENELRYLPLGVGAILPPWNFAFAILVGMSSAAIVAGNTVVLKPSSDSPLTGYQFVRVMEDAGLPPGVLNFLTGSGGEIGDTIVTHPLTRFIAFTGSKEVGLRINELAAKPAPGQKWIKRVVAEMGGKDAIVVDKDVDLDTVAEGIVASAFGFQGQKCSACSRAIIVEDVYELMVQKIVERTRRITVGPVDQPDNWMGPVINRASQEKILSYIEHGKQHARLVAGGGLAGDQGYFLSPTVFADVAPDDKLSQEEIFGPVLAITKARDFDEALDIANNTEFGLTGAVYSNNEEHLQKAQEEFFVGNLYLNRKCTGAMVGAHPFGGFNMSGTDSKAGGRDYLMLFTQAKVWARKV